MDNEYQNYHKNRKNDIYHFNMALPQFLIKVLPSDKKANILDIGCGNGNVLYALRKRGYQNLHGIDLDEEVVKFVKRHGIPCEKTNIIGYKPNEKYDFILMNHIMEHLPKKEVIPLLSYIRTSLLNPKGKIVIRVPNAQAYTGCYWAYEDFTHETLYTTGSLDYVLRSAGFRRITFLDQDGLDGTSYGTRLIRKIFLRLYDKKVDFWNRVTGSAFHIRSPRIYTWEVKVIASK